jgi:hypothetical protein
MNTPATPKLLARPSRPPRRWSWILGAVVAFLLLPLLVLVGMYLYTRHRTAQEVCEAVAEIEPPIPAGGSRTSRPPGRLFPTSRTGPCECERPLNSYPLPPPLPAPEDR